MNKVISLEALKRLVLTPLGVLINRKVDKVAGKGLSTNDFTNEEKEKLAGIESGAQVNVQSDWNETDETSMAYIQNKPVEETEEDAMELLTEMGVIDPVTDEEGNVLTDENGSILTI